MSSAFLRCTFNFQEVIEAGDGIDLKLGASSSDKDIEVRDTSISINLLNEIGINLTDINVEILVALVIGLERGFTSSLVERRHY